jgi:hypothetical protein
MSGWLAVLVGGLLAVAGAAALSPLGPVGPVRQFDPVRGFEFDPLVLVGGGATLVVVGSGLLAVLAWRSENRRGTSARPVDATTWHNRVAARLPLVATLGARYALDPPPGARRAVVRANLIGSVAAITAVVTAVVFGASLNGLVTHPARYGWNWNVLIQVEGGYGSFVDNPAQFHGGDGTLGAVMARLSGVRSWSTFGFTQLAIDGHIVPVLGLDAEPPTSAVEPPTTSGHALDGPDEIEIGSTTLTELDRHVGEWVRVGSGRLARRLRIVGTVTLPSLGVQLTDHVSLGRGAMLPEATLLALEGFSLTGNVPSEAFSALPSAVAIDLEPGTASAPIVRRIVTADPGDNPGGINQVPRVLGAAVVNASEMGAQPIVLAVTLAVAVLVAISGSITVSARRRRRELALVRALGCTRSQILGVVACQALTVLVVAVVFGLPLGVVAGRWTWMRFADSLGVVSVVVVPLVGLVLGTVALIAVGVILGSAPGALAGSRSTASLLRRE